ncbi:MAG: Rieske 2Fe-2S domain-containing protein [Haloferacaceae archaeon]
MTRYRVAAADDLAEGERVVVDLDGREVAVFRVEETFHALANHCVHQGGPVCEGQVSGTLAADGDGGLCYEREGEVVSCPWHGWEFDVRTGEALADRSYRQPTYEVVTENGEVYVEA